MSNISTLGPPTIWQQIDLPIRLVFFNTEALAIRLSQQDDL